MDDDFIQDEPKEELYMAVAHALNECQSLELSIKRHIGASYEVARKYIGEIIVFEIGEKDYEKQALGQLINTYSKLTSDTQLVKELMQFASERNFLAHKAIVESYLPDGTFSPNSSPGLLDRIIKIKKPQRT